MTTGGTKLLVNLAKSQDYKMTVNIVQYYDSYLTVIILLS